MRTFCRNQKTGKKTTTKRKKKKRICVPPLRLIMGLGIGNRACENKSFWKYELKATPGLLAEKWGAVNCLPMHVFADLNNSALIHWSTNSFNTLAHTLEYPDTPFDQMGWCWQPATELNWLHSLSPPQFPEVSDILFQPHIRVELSWVELENAPFLKTTPKFSPGCRRLQKQKKKVDLTLPPPQHPPYWQCYRKRCGQD